MTQSSISCDLGHLLFKSRCKSCKDIQSNWYGQLNSKGFNDIEKHGLVKNSIDILNGNSKFKSTSTYELNLDYYLWAKNKANEGRFLSTNDKTIWELHAEGLTRREISPVVGFEQSWITRKIHRIEQYLKNQVLGSITYEAQV